MSLTFAGFLFLSLGPLTYHPLGYVVMYQEPLLFIAVLWGVWACSNSLQRSRVLGGR